MKENEAAWPQVCEIGFPSKVPKFFFFFFFIRQLLRIAYAAVDAVRL
jgi:hypothetical protein